MATEAFLRNISTSISYAVWISGFVVLNGYLVYFYSIRKNKARYFAFPITGKILSLFHVNNPDFFPDLNETALKKNIALKVSECPLNEIIHRISLHQGAINHYQLVVRAPECHKNFSVIQRFFEQDPDSLFDEHFIEVYRDKPSITFPHQKGSFWNDWGNGIVLDTDKDLPESVASNKYKWLLYKK